MQEQEVARKLELCVGSFKKVLYEPDDIFLKNMEKNNLAGDDISKYQLWEWTQGVGLYGLWKLFEKKHDRRAVSGDAAGILRRAHRRRPARQKHQHHGARPGVVLSI